MVQLEVFSTSSSRIASVSLSDTATVKDLKKEIARARPKLQECRQSVRTEARGKDLKDSTLVNTLQLTDAKVYVKDLGPQISWTVVFLAEYFGPLVTYSLFAIRPELIYGAGASQPLTTSAAIAWACWSIHYSKRLLETVFVHRFSHGTMPIRNLFKNCGYYWGFAAYVAYHVNHPLYTPPSVIVGLAGLGLFALCEAGNLSCHVLLRNLRPPGTTVRRIPVPNGNPLTVLFKYVSCPNYTYEFGAWLGFTLLTSCLPAGVFAAAGMFQMSLWALGKHKNYRAEFKDYPRMRKAIVPFVL